MRVPAFSTDLKEFKLHTVYSGISEHLKPLQLVGQVAEFKFEPKFEPLPVIWQLLKAIPEGIEGFDCRINGQALGAALRRCKHENRAFPCRRQSMLVATVSLERKTATTLEILAQFKSQKVLMACNFGQ